MAPFVLPANIEEYREQYRKSCENRLEFWDSQARQLCWQKAFSSAYDPAGRIWFPGGKLNACENALDRFMKDGGDNAVVASEFDPQNRLSGISRMDLARLVHRVAAGLQDLGCACGDRVGILLSEGLPWVVASLAIARIGAVAVPISRRFSGAFMERILDNAQVRFLFLSENGVPDSVLVFLQDIASRKSMEIIHPGPGPFDGFGSERTVDPVPVSAEHPLFLLYPGTGGSIPRGYVYSTGGFLTQTGLSSGILAHRGQDKNTASRVWTTSEPAALPSLAYGLWGALIRGATIVTGLLTNQNATERITAVVSGDGTKHLFICPHQFAQLDLAPLSPDQRFTTVCLFGDAVGPRMLRRVVDTLTGESHRVLNLWTSTQTGCALLSTLPVPELNRHGSIGLPLFGVIPRIVNDFGKPCGVNESGNLVIEEDFPGLCRTIDGQPERFRQLHFTGEGLFQTNDGVRLDADGFFWFMKRLDDVMKVEGHSVSTSEMEATLSSHPDVREAAVLGIEGHETGDQLVAFVTPAQSAGLENPAHFEKTLRIWLGEHAGDLFLPIRFHIVREIPRTRSGKVERRLLHRILTGEMDLHEDLGHLGNPEAVRELMGKGPQDNDTL